MDYTEKVLRHINGYRGVIVDVDIDMVEVPNGNHTVREVVKHPGGVCVAAVDEDGTVAMVRQYRYPMNEHLLELPAGKLEPGEDPLPAAQRELSEETGLTADSWQSMGFLYTSPGFSTERLYLYLATGLHHGEQHLDLNEFLDVEYYPLETLRELVLRGDLSDGKTVAGLLKAAELFGKT